MNAREQNRAWVHECMPEFERLFDNLAAAGMEPRMVKLEKFT